MSNKIKIKLKLAKTLKFSGFLLAILAFLIFPVMEAEAGFFSFIEKLFNIKSKDVVHSSNAATMSLLEAPAGTGLSGKNAVNINVVDQGYLLVNSGPLGTIADIENIASTQISLYTVREGDTLFEIAKMFQVDVNTIRWANDLPKRAVIKAGQQLVILPISGIKYTVQKGDTVSSIAKKFGGAEEEIIQFNDLEPDSLLAAGQSLIIPNGELAAEPETQKTPTRRKYADSAPSYSGYYLRPIKGGYKSQGIHGYNGVDLATDCGEPIYASASGDALIARTSGWNGGYGKYIVISHPNGTQTLYSHNSENVVTAGWHVAQGQIIGYIGRSGLTTGCHVHFEIRGARNPF